PQNSPFSAPNDATPRRASVTDAPQRDSAVDALERRLNALLIGGGLLTISAAESCSGGETAHRITAIAGSSDYFLGSIVAYANDAKMNLLDVPRDVIETRGTVSEECARAMAEGARLAFGSDIAV